jgi:hypothetical protein
VWTDLTVDDWKQEIDRGLKYRKVYGREESWSTLEKLFYSQHPSQINSTGPNILASTGDGLLSTLSVPEPYVTIKAKRQDYLQAASVLESVDNMLIEEMEMPTEVERACLACYQWGRGFLKIGYDSEYGWDDSWDIGGRNPFGISQSQFDQKGRRIEFHPTQPGMPWIKAVMPHDIVVPWGTYDIEDAPWIAHRIVRHVDDVKADIKYEKKKNLQGVMSMSDFVKSYETVNKPYRTGRVERFPDADDNDTDYVEMWEIHDRRTGRVIVVATGHDKFLRNAPDVLQGEGLPFVGISFIPRTRNFWTTPDCYYLRPHQSELNDIAIQRQKHRRLSVLKWIYGEDAFDETELSSLLSPTVGAAIKAKAGTNLKDAIVPLTAPYNQTLALEAPEVRRDARERVGMRRNKVGEFEGGRRTASEVQAVQQSSDLRMDRRSSGLAKMYKLAFKKINTIITRQWKANRIAEIIDQDGQSVWIKYNGPSLKGDYVYSVGFSPTGGGETIQSRKAMAMQWYMAIQQDPMVDPLKARQFLARAINDPSFSNIFKDGVLNGTAQMGGNPTGSLPQGQGTQQGGTGTPPPQGLLSGPGM